MPRDPSPGDVRERILAAAEAQLRRYGPGKLAVMDIARALEMSHANVYRFFPSKAAIVDAVTDRWLRRVEARLAAAPAEGDAAARIEAWLVELHRAKRRKRTDDPELYHAFEAIAEDAREVVTGHVERMREMLRGLVRDGIAAGRLPVRDAEAAVEALWTGTIAFHHPKLVPENLDDGAEDRLRVVTRALLAGLAAGGV